MDAAGIYARRFEPLDRAVQLGVASGRVISVSFPETPPADATPDHEFLDRIGAYLDGDATALDGADVALTVPTEQRTVLEALRNVPPGNTITVSRLARIAGWDPEAEGVEDTVRDALRANPVPLFIPDHRVRDASGSTPAQIAAALRRLER